MAKAGRLSSKLRSALKKMNSFGNSKKLSRDNSSTSSSSSSSSSNEHGFDQCITTASAARGLQKVYVGRSRREYQVPAELLHHPVVRELVDTSATNDDGSVIGCEVVLFDHLCWMLEKNNGTGSHIQPLDDLAAFYAY